MKILKIIGILVLAAVGLFAATVMWSWHRTTSPEEFSGTQVHDLCYPGFAVEGFELNPTDTLEHAWKPGKWMDSKTYCSMKTTPERVAAFKKALMDLDGKVLYGNKTTVSHTPPDCKGDETACRHYGPMPNEKLPAWWPDATLREAEWFGVNMAGNHSHGMDYVISEPEGLIFAHIWGT